MTTAGTPARTVIVAALAASSSSSSSTKVGALHPRALAIVDMHRARHEASGSCRFADGVQVIRQHASHRIRQPATPIAALWACHPTRRCASGKQQWRIGDRGHGKGAPRPSHAFRACHPNRASRRDGWNAVLPAGFPSSLWEANRVMPRSGGQRKRPARADVVLRWVGRCAGRHALPPFPAARHAFAPICHRWTPLEIGVVY